MLAPNYDWAQTDTSPSLAKLSKKEIHDNVNDWTVNLIKAWVLIIPIQSVIRWCWCFMIRTDPPTPLSFTILCLVVNWTPYQTIQSMGLEGEPPPPGGMSNKLNHLQLQHLLCWWWWWWIPGWTPYHSLAAFPPSLWLDETRAHTTCSVD